MNIKEKVVTEKKINAKNILIPFVFLVLGIFVGQNMLPWVEKVYAMKNTETPASVQEADFDPFWKVWALLQENFENTIPENYILATSTTSSSSSKLHPLPSNQEKVWGAIKGLTASYNDPYTTFFDPSETKSFADVIRGEFEGVGMEITIKEGVLTVVSPLKGSPAERAGILPGDRILKINDASTESITTERAVTLIKGEKGTTVTLTVSREGATPNPFEVKIQRDRITAPVIDTEMKNGVFIIKLYSFSENSAKLFQKALKDFTESGTDKLVIDLRNNPGGYLDAAVSMGSWFLPEGTPIVRETQKNKAEQIFRSVGYNVFPSDFKFVILVNEGSASASEILAAALHENGKAVLVGERTFGKGTVQQLMPVTEDTSIKITIAKWLTPKGHSISYNGVYPQVVVKMTEEDVKNKKDPQMEKALEIATQKTYSQYLK
jgi:carboxyl-terminal processing protease